MEQIIRESCAPNVRREDISDYMRALGYDIEDMEMFASSDYLNFSHIMSHILTGSEFTHDHREYWPKLWLILRDSNARERNKMRKVAPTKRPRSVPVLYPTPHFHTSVD